MNLFFKLLSPLANNLRGDVDLVLEDGEDLLCKEAPAGRPAVTTTTTEALKPVTQLSEYIPVKHAAPRRAASIST